MLASGLRLQASRVLALLALLPVLLVTIALSFAAPAGASTAPAVSRLLVRPTAHAASSSSTSSALPQVGVQFHGLWTSYTDTQRATVLDAMKAAGMSWVRIDVSWDMLQPQARGAYDMAWGVPFVDHVIDMATSRGLSPLVTLYQTPAWANGGAGLNVPPTNVGDYASVAAWAAARWAGKVPALEIWNEPNLTDFWAGADPVKYAQLIRAAYPAIKAANPAMTVLSGGVSYNDDAWLARAYAAGMHGAFDVLATHPYQGPADAAPATPDDGSIWHLTHVVAIRNLMVANGDAAKHIWFTEMGWSTHVNTAGEPPWWMGVSEAQQATNSVAAVQMIAAQYPYVSNVFFYNERDRTDAGVQDDNYGLMHSDLTPKPVLGALHTLLSSVGTSSGSGTSCAKWRRGASISRLPLCSDLASVLWPNGAGEPAQPWTCATVTWGAYSIVTCQRNGS